MLTCQTGIIEGHCGLRQGGALAVHRQSMKWQNSTWWKALTVCKQLQYCDSVQATIGDSVQLLLTVCKQLLFAVQQATIVDSVAIKYCWQCSKQLLLTVQQATSVYSAASNYCWQCSNQLLLAVQQATIVYSVASNYCLQCSKQLLLTAYNYWWQCASNYIVDSVASNYCWQCSKQLLFTVQQATIVYSVASNYYWQRTTIGDSVQATILLTV